MSQLQIATVCTQCQKHFLSKKRRSKFCSNLCRAQYDRDKKSLLLKSKDKVIRTQAKIIESVIPDSVHVCPECDHKISTLTEDECIREITKMLLEAKQLARNACGDELRWSGYLKDPAKFQWYCKAISSGAVYRK